MTRATSAGAISKYEILREFRKSKSGTAGAIMLLGLIAMTIYSALAVPLESFRQWNNPNFWIDLPRAAAPAWTNIGFGPKAPEHIVMTSSNAEVTNAVQDGMRTVTHSYNINFNYDAFPSDFMLLYSARYSSTQPVLQIDVVRPDGNEFR